MFKRATVMAFAVVTNLFSAASVQADSLAEALASAYNSSGLLDQNRALLRAADEGAAQAFSALLPVVTWAASATRTEVDAPVAGRTDSALLQISASLTLYDGGVSRLGIDAQQEVVLATRQTLRSVEQDVLLRAVVAYMNVVRDREFVQLRQNNLRLITQELRAARDRFEVGEVTRTDVALAEARLASARSLLAAEQGSLARSIEEYIAATGRTPSGVQSVAPAPVSRNISEAKAFAVRNHPAVLEAQHTVSAAEINIRRGYAALRPSVSLNANISTDNDSNETSQIGLNMGGPIYNGGLITSQARQLVASRDQARAGLHLTTIAIEQQVGNEFALLEVARASAQASELQIEASRIAFEGVREEATLGSRTTLDVLDAEQELLDAEANRIAAQADEVIASYSLLAAMGLLTADHLNLPVQQYDPAEYYNLVKNAPPALSAQGRALNRVLQALGEE